uniref:olfactory receptor 12-like isoform X1 n=1 Tax=Euleptes europaea TaxID=460621 RepID=UPI00253FD0DF|nr:olfactory receptor 12-like isoform X1 [Euleptes europaea]XP_056722722.1 olfactory receptor 12-like isoform X1 [Euleptes europaea]
MGNHTVASEFILVGFRGKPEMQSLLFVLFLIMYIVTMMGNIGMILVISADSKLHTPMYFFLKNLSFLDICYSSVITPKAMLSFATGNKAISYNGCATQMFFFSLFGTTEAFFLAVMAYDRFIAVCNPLLYQVIMSKKTRHLLVVVSYFFGCVNCCTQTGFTFSLTFCAPTEINHFFCDVPAVMKASCSATFMNEIVLLVVCGLIIVTTGIIVLISYGYIVATILRIPSGKGRHKAFSTCTSHLMAVSLFFGTVFFMYAQPGAISSPNRGKVVSVFYTVVIPMLNPIIYSLRNAEVKEATNKISGRV